MSKYIKVTQKDKSPVVVLAGNRSFYANQKDTKITEPTQEEIVQFFPEEAGKTDVAHEDTKMELAQAIANVVAEKQTANAELEKVKSAHEIVLADLETAQARVLEVETANAELAKAIATIEAEKAELQAEIEKLKTSKKQ